MSIAPSENELGLLCRTCLISRNKKGTTCVLAAKWGHSGWFEIVIVSFARYQIGKFRGKEHCGWYEVDSTCP
jgi:hypothetical protein